MQTKRAAILVVIAVASTTAARAQTGGGYDLTWSNLDCASTNPSSGGGYELGATIGQADAGNLAGGAYALQGGFWSSSNQPTDAPPDTTEGSGPFVFRLQGNIPNPFTSQTSISFSLAREEDVRLRVYDLAGRVVRTVLESRLGAGRHQVAWDGRDDAGRSVAQGIYFLRLRAGSFKADRKMALLR